MSKRMLDVWIVEMNTVYRDVPFTVVADWLQQGRLLGDDRVRPAGSEKWYLIAKVPSLAAYVPQVEPFRADDQAEALEPVETGFHWRRPREDEDDDIDMIPLIDISLVLLIFFMMTAAVSTGVISTVKTPEASHQLAEIGNGMLWLSIDVANPNQAVKDERGEPWYSLGVDRQSLHEPTQDLAEVLQTLRGRLAQEQGRVKISLRADRSLPIETIKGATLQLQGLASHGGEGASKVEIEILGEVSDSKSP